VRRERAAVVAKTSSARRFRRCPLCASEAISAATQTGLGHARYCWSARCGECRSWRTDVLSTRDTRQLLCWLASDRACIKEALERSRWTDLARELGEPARSVPRRAHAR